MLDQCIRSLSDGLEGTGAESKGVCVREEKEGWHLRTWKPGGSWWPRHGRSQDGPVCAAGGESE